MRISDPAPVTTDLKPRRNRGVHCIRLVRLISAAYSHLISFENFALSIQFTLSMNRNKPK